MNIIYTLITIRFRKYFSKGDFLSVFFIITIYLFVAYFSFLNFEKTSNWFYLLFTDPVFYHFKRKDLDFLKIYKKSYLLIFYEYLIYVGPFLIVLLLKQEFFTVAFILLFYLTLIIIPKYEIRVQSLPFQLLDPFWNIIFRKYKIILWLPIVFVISFMGWKHNNINLQYFVLTCFAVTCCLPSFERERKVEICYAAFNSTKYLMLQLKSTFFNSMMLLGSLGLILFFTFFDWNLLLFTLVLMAIPQFNIVLKYSFFDSVIQQQIVFIIGIMTMGLVLFAIPYLYSKAVKNLKEIKNVDN